MRKIAIKLFIMCLIFLCTIPTYVSAAGNSATFEKSKGQGFIDDLVKINNSLIYVEDNDTDGMVIRYFDARTMKQKCNIAIDKCVGLPILGENYFVVHTLGGVDSGGKNVWDRIVYDVKTAKKQVLATKIGWESSGGHVYNNSVFIFRDAIYDFDRNFSLTNVKDIHEYFCDDLVELSCEIGGKNYIFNPKTLSLSEYQNIDGVGDYILKSGKYGFLYIKDDSVYWQKPDKSLIKVCSYQKIDDDISNNTYSFKQYGFNISGNAIYIINSPASYVVIDLKSGRFKSFNMSKPFHGMMFGPDNKSISLLYNIGKGAQQEWLTDLTYVDSKGKSTYLSADATNITYFKNYLVYESGIQPMGMTDTFISKLNVYDINTGKTTALKGNMHNYNIIGGKLYARVYDASYLFDTNKKTFTVQTKVKKYIGNGIYMVKLGADVSFMDKNNALVNFHSLPNEPICAILPGYTKGFLYDGINLKTITLPDTKRFTKSSDIKICDGYISYSYPVVVKGVTHTYIRILKV